MPITHLHQKELASRPMSSEEVDRIVMNIVTDIGTTYKDFQHASSTYNSVFFHGESPEFKRELCRALKNHFGSFQNSFWNKASQGNPD